MKKQIAVLAFSLLSLSCVHGHVIGPNKNNTSPTHYFAHCGISLEANVGKNVYEAEDGYVWLTVTNLSLDKTVRVWLYDDKNGQLKEPHFFYTFLPSETKDTVVEWKLRLNSWFWAEVRPIDSSKSCLFKFVLVTYTP